MTKEITKGVCIAVVAFLALAGLHRFGFLDLWPFDTDIHEVTTEVEQTQAGEVYRLDPIGLDCRARINVFAAVEVKRDHRAGPVVYRTDKYQLDAYGDVDTCMPVEAVSIAQTADDRWLVDIDASMIEFVRPRVDNSHPDNDDNPDTGFVGEVFGLFPGVSDDTGLTGIAYTYAQTVIGSSACMEVAWEATIEAIEQAYHEHGLLSGLVSGQLEISINGTPNFNQHGDLESLQEHFSDIDFSVRDEGISCELATE